MPQPARKTSPFVPMTNQRKSYGQRIREKIDTTRIVERVCLTAMGEDQMTMAELTAARMILDRTLPTLKPLETKPEGEQDAKTITNADLFKVIEGQAKRLDK